MADDLWREYHAYHKTRLTEYTVKTLELVFGLFFFAAGAYLWETHKTHKILVL